MVQVGQSRQFPSESTCVSLQELALAAYADIMAADSVIAVVILFILLASLVKESK